MRKRLQVWISFTVCLMILLLGTVMRGQSVHGTLAGTVADSTGAVIGDAKVDIVNTRTAATYTASTTSAGFFRFEDVALGEYVVTVTAKGFKTSVTKGVLVQIGTVS
jgi:hypothetical protein